MEPLRLFKRAPYNFTHLKVQMMTNFLLKKNKRRLRSEYIKGFYTGRDLQWTLGPAASIPYSLAQVEDEGWLVGDESGNIWCLDEAHQGTPNSFENILEFESGVSEISPLNRFKVLIGEMRGNVTQLDLSHLTAETINQIKCVKHRAPVKCIRWQPNQSEIFATASQDGSIIFADLRSPNNPLGFLNGSHQLGSIGKSGRSTITGFLFHPQKPELFYTSGTPDTCVRLWDMRKLSNYTSISSANPSTSKRTSKRSLSNKLTPTEEFSTSSYNLRKHRSSTALTIDSIGSRLFLATSNDNIFEFITSNSDVGPVASYTAPGFNSCSFFSNLSIDPTDRFLLSGSSNGQAYIWDTLSEKDSSETEYHGGVFELPVCAQLEVSKTAWVSGKRGSLEAQIACISDDLTFSLFNWNLQEAEENCKNNLNSLKRPKELFTEGREEIHLFDSSVTEELHSHKETTMTQSSPLISTSTASNQIFFVPPITPIRKKPPTSNNFNLIGTPPSSANKSILDFFTRSPRV